MKRFITVIIGFLTMFSSVALSETMDLKISNPRVESGIFKFEVQIKRTDLWSATFAGIGNCDFYFNNNAAGFTGNPSLSNIHSEISNKPGNYSILVQITGGQLQVKLTYALQPPFAVWNPTLNSFENICTVEWTVGDPSQNSGVTWDQINSGFADAEGDAITPTYLGSGDISLPVELSSFTANILNGNVILKWSTESEINNAGFEIWRAPQENGDYNLISGYQNNPDLKGQGNATSQNNYQFTDRNVFPDQTYWYKLADVDMNGEKHFHGPVSLKVALAEGEAKSISPTVPKRFKLYPNFPNPFNPSTEFQFDIPRLSQGKVNTKIMIYNSVGQAVATVFEGKISAGSYRAKWNGHTANGANAPSGLYFAVMKSSHFTDTVKMILMR